MEQNENTLDNLWPISSCPGFLNDLRDPNSAKLNYRLLFGKPWQAIRDAYQWILPNQKCRHKVNEWISNECMALFFHQIGLQRINLLSIKAEIYRIEWIL